MVHVFFHSGNLFWLSISEMLWMTAAIEGEQRKYTKYGNNFSLSYAAKLMKIPLDMYDHDLTGTVSLKNGCFSQCWQLHCWSTILLIISSHQYLHMNFLKLCMPLSIKWCIQVNLKFDFFCLDIVILLGKTKGHAFHLSQCAFIMLK